MIRIGVRSFVAGAGNDADAIAFIIAAGITNATQQSAINTLVVDLKAYGIWTKMKAIYPFVGGTASTHKWNLKDPRDLNAAFRLVFSGGWTHSSTGALPNGTNAYADTKLTPNSSLSLNNTSVSYYSRTDNTTGIDDLSVVTNEVDPSDPSRLRLIINLSGSLIVDHYAVGQRISISNSNSIGFYQSIRISSTDLKVYKNSSEFGSRTTTNTGTLPTSSLYLGAANRNSSSIFFSNRQCAFASIGDGLTDTEAANFYTVVQAYQTTLSRNV
jgi:hypothetical protein